MKTIRERTDSFQRGIEYEVAGRVSEILSSAGWASEVGEGVTCTKSFGEGRATIRTEHPSGPFETTVRWLSDSTLQIAVFSESSENVADDHLRVTYETDLPVAVLAERASEKIGAALESRAGIRVNHLWATLDCHVEEGRI